jgi:hypothetical protein
MIIVRLERLGKWEKCNDLIGTRTRDLPACSLVSQPTTLPRDPNFLQNYYYYIFMFNLVYIQFSVNNATIYSSIHIIFRY